MKLKFQQYLDDIGVTKPIQRKVEYFYRLCIDLAFEPLLDIFIEEYLNQDKSRVYEGLSFYSKNYTFSIPYFLTSDDIAIVAHHNVQDWIRITVKNFNFKKAHKDSLMNVALFGAQGNSTGNYRASRKNCKYLVKILSKYVKPYLTK